MEHSQRIQYLFSRYQLGQCTLRERIELMTFIRDHDNEPGIMAFIADQLQRVENGDLPEGASPGSMTFNSILEQIKKEETIHRIPRIRSWGWAAASIILLLGIGAYIWSSRPPRQAPVIAKARDIAPGKTGAVLTLANGSEVVLDSLANGVIARQNGVQVLLQNGQLAYDHSGETTGTIVYNTMRTPNGRQFQLMLPDGSRVWLNAASSIRYPTMFSTNERTVEISGEAYFEVVKNEKKPFRVKINETAEVEVLGTSFNISSYKNEYTIKTTLIEGSVRISAYKKLQVLKPGQQAIVTSSQQLNVVDRADIGKALAWKNGLFDFDGMRLREVMKQLERWYDIEVIYERGAPDVGFYGEIDRNISLASILEVLERSDIHFRIEGRKLIVLP